jgi:hypothetical protein
MGLRRKNTLRRRTNSLRRKHTLRRRKNTLRRKKKSLRRKKIKGGATNWLGDDTGSGNAVRYDDDINGSLYINVGKTGRKATNMWGPKGELKVSGVAPHKLSGVAPRDKIEYCEPCGDNATRHNGTVLDMLPPSANEIWINSDGKPKKIFNHQIME